MMHSVMIMSLGEEVLVFKPEMEVKLSVGVLELLGVAGTDVGMVEELVDGVAVEPVGVGVSPPAAPVVIDITIRQGEVKTIKEKRPKRVR
jgi:hypothetical protein